MVLNKWNNGKKRKRKRALERENGKTSIIDSSQSNLPKANGQDGFGGIVLKLCG